jgi:hypothetical protein
MIALLSTARTDVNLSYTSWLRVETPTVKLSANARRLIRLDVYWPSVKKRAKPGRLVRCEARVNVQWGDGKLEIPVVLVVTE